MMMLLELTTGKKFTSILPTVKKGIYILVVLCYNINITNQNLHEYRKVYESIARGCPNINRDCPLRRCATFSCGTDVR